MRRQDVWLTAADGTKLHAWYLHPRTLASAAQRRQRPAVLFLQENAGNMALRLPFLRLLARYLDCSILALRCAVPGGLGFDDVRGSETVPSVPFST